MQALQTVGQAPMSDFDQYENIGNVLRAWARWRWENHGANIGYPSEAPFRRMMLVEGEALEKPCQLLIVAKQRNAPFEGMIGLSLNREAMQFRESERQRLHLVFERSAA